MSAPVVHQDDEAEEEVGPDLEEEEVGPDLGHRPLEFPDHSRSYFSRRNFGHVLSVRCQNREWSLVGASKHRDWQIRGAQSWLE